MDSQSKAPPYPRELELRYPKVGETNPTATFHLLDLSDLAAGPQEIEFESFAPEDLLITEVAWVAEEHEAVIFRTMNRVQNLEKLIVVDVKSAESSVVRERDGTDGWIDNNLAIQCQPLCLPIFYLLPMKLTRVIDIPGLSTPSYIDISDHTGYAHLYLYPVAGGSPIVLTSGEYEVISIVKVDVSRNVVYYLSTERDSTERHLYSVGLDGKGKKALVDTNKDGYWAASFSDGGAYYILSYRGPDLPHQELYSVNNTNVAIKTMTDNAALKTKLAEFNLPTVSWSTLKHPDGYELNVVEYLPPNFDPKKKYQVLFDIYGGPGSQETGKTFRRNVGWSSYVTSDPELEYIILSVDNRGTGFKGRAFRTLVNRQLGKLEAQDQVWAAQQWAKKSYVDEKKIAIWGWSFGGYLTSKVLELDSGVFSLGLVSFKPSRPHSCISADTATDHRPCIRLAFL
jgi:dipeptidyl-peptidase-4